MQFIVEKQALGLTLDPPADDTVVVIARGCTLTMPRNEGYLYYATYVAGSYSQLIIRSGDKVLDAGANVGDFTLLAARMAGPTGRVIAVEPSHRAVDLLRHNLVMNSVSNVDVFRGFLSATPGRVRISERGTYASIAGKDALESTEIEQMTLDDVARKARVDHFDVIKMDIEGSEGLALRGCSTLENVRELMIEVHSSRLDEEVREILQPLGFQWEQYDPARMAANVVLSVLTHPRDVLYAERSFGGLAVSSAIAALGGKSPSPSLARSSGLRILHFFRPRPTRTKKSSTHTELPRTNRSRV